MNLFQTTANTANNSFQDPLNPFNTTQGAWGIDPTYLTPSYAAPYRPQYQGPQGAAPPNRNVGFGTSFYNVFTPFGNNHMYGDTVQQDDPYYSALAYRPVDTGMWGLQRGVLPAVAFAAGMKVAGGKVASNSAAYSWISQNARYGAGMVRGLGKEEAMAEAVSGAANMSRGAWFGSSVGQGMARGINAGFGVTGAAATGFEGAAGVLGAAAGSLFGGLAVGQAITGVAQGAIFDPYSAIRRTTTSMRENFANIMAGTGDNGNRVDGFGMSRKYASNLATRLTKDSIKDMSLDTYGMGDLTDFAARSGQLDDVQLEQLEGRMKTLAKQVKVMMRVANEPDFRAAMQMMAELKVAGVNADSAGRVLQNIGGSSAIAGVSVQKMMNTVGAQGQYLYQSNGLTPYLGQTQAASTYGAFSSAYRMGLISDNTMARFGGREGITQLAVTGQVNAAQTPYNQIMLMNQAFGKGSGGGVVGNLSNFGQMAAGDPLGAAGAMGLYDGELTSKQLMDKGSGAFLDQIHDIAQAIPGMMNADGKIDVEKAYLLMTRQMNMPPQEAKAMLKELQVSGDKRVLAQSSASLSGNMKRDTIKYLEQEGLGAGALNQVIVPVRTLWKDIKAGGAGAVGDLAESTGEIGDSLEHWFNGARTGSLVKNSEANSFDEFEGKDSPKSKKYTLKTSPVETAKKWLARLPGPTSAANWTHKFWGDGTWLYDDNTRYIDAVNGLVHAGDKNAAIVSDPNASKKDRAAALNTLNASGKLGDFMKSDALAKLTDQIIEGGTVEETPSGPVTKADSVRKNLTESTGKTANMMDQLGILDAARKVSTGQGDAQSEKLMRDTYGKDLDPTQLREKATDVYLKSAENGVAHLTSMMNGKSSADLVKAGEAGSREEFGTYAADLQKQIKEIKANPNLSSEEKDQKVQDATMYARSKVTGVPFAPVLDPKIISKGNLTADTLDKSSESARETARLKLNLEKLASQNVINFDTKYSATAAIDLTQAVDSFGKFVSDFGKATDSFAGKTADTPSGGHGPVGQWIIDKFSKSTSTPK